jgi:hypothetical protein
MISAQASNFLRTLDGIGQIYEPIMEWTLGIRLYLLHGRTKPRLRLLLGRFSVLCPSTGCRDSR